MFGQLFLDFMSIRTLNMYLLIEFNLAIKLKVCVVSHFELSGLRCEMINMPLKRVSGRDINKL